MFQGVCIKIVIMLRFYLLLVVLLTNFAVADELTLTPAKNFFKDSQQVWKNKTPILIMFSIPDCEFCKKVKQEIVGPMAELKEYDDKVIIRHIDSSSFDDIKNFYNEEVSNNEFSSRYAINFFPTVLLVDQYGVILEKVLGVTNEEYYWTDLDQLIDKATTKINKQMSAKL
ncbi:MAG TPA: thioredoxin family protein [Candidatus Thioglobus sp.]|nr:thioredoxin family protein [Candidatus Thioglobus sp.]